LGPTKVQTHNHANGKSMHNHFNQLMLRGNAYNCKIILSLHMINHIIKIIINQTTHKWHT